MAYEVVMSYHLHMPWYDVETFTEYPNLSAEIKLVPPLMEPALQILKPAS